MRTQTLTSGTEDVQLPVAVNATGWLAPEPGDPAETGTPDSPGEGRRAGRSSVRRSRGRVAARVRRRTPDRTRRSAVRLHHPTRAVPAPEVLGKEEPEGVGYRMSRWARLSLTVTVLATAVVVVAALTAGPPSRRLVDVTVAPGDSLWSIAASSAPDRDPRAVIEEIKQLNDVSGDILPVGVVLRVPASDG